MAATEGPMNLVKLIKVSYAPVTGFETTAPTTLKDLLASQIQEGKFNFDIPAPSMTLEHAADRSTYRARRGDVDASASMSLWGVTLSDMQAFTGGTYTAGTAGTTPSVLDEVGNEVVSNMYVVITGLNSAGQTVTYVLYNTVTSVSQSGNMDEAQETVPLVIKFTMLKHPGIGKTRTRTVAF